MQDKLEEMGVFIGDERYLTQVQVADLLDVRVETVYRWMKRSDFPKRTDRKKFLRSEIVEWYTHRS